VLNSSASVLSLTNSARFKVRVKKVNVFFLTTEVPQDPHLLNQPSTFTVPSTASSKEVGVAAIVTYNFITFGVNIARQAWFKIFTFFLKSKIFTFCC